MKPVYSAILILSLLFLGCSREPLDLLPKSGAVAVTGLDPLSLRNPDTSFELKNTGAEALNWSAEIIQDRANPARDWFTLSQPEGRLEPDETIALTLTLKAGLAPGLYKARVKVVYQGGETPVEVLGSVGNGEAGEAQLIGTLTTDNARIRLVSGFSQTADPLAAEHRTAESDTAKINTAKINTAEVNAAERPAYVPGQVLIQYSDVQLQTQSVGIPMSREMTKALTAERVSADYGLQVLKRREAGQPDLVQTREDVLELITKLTRDPRVEYAEPNYYLYPTSVPNDPFLEGQWALAAAGIPVAWNAATGQGADVVVAVVDSGFDLNHPDLKGRFLPGYDFCAKLVRNACGASDADASYGQPSNGHGSHVAGIIGAARNNKGVVGVAYGAGVKLLPIKIFDDTGLVADANTFLEGIRWAAGLRVNAGGVTLRNPNKADIINISLGSFFSSQSVQGAINEARAAGVLLLAASGNNGVNQIMNPAAADNVIAVGSINPDYKRSCFSNYGSGKDLGPGKLDLVTAGGEGYPELTPPSIGVPPPDCFPIPEGIISTVPGSYDLKRGTSMATPIASGVAALILARQPGLSVSELEAALLASTYFNPEYMSEEEYGAGVLRAEYALGLPGPGADVTVSASSPRDSAVTTATLDLYGSSSPYALSTLAAGQYTVEAKTGGASALTAKTQLALQEGELKRVNMSLSFQSN